MDDIYTNLVSVDSWLRHMVNEAIEIVFAIFQNSNFARSHCEPLVNFKSTSDLSTWLVLFEIDLKIAIMKFVIDLVSKHSGRIGTLTKADIDIKTPLILHYTKVSQSLPTYPAHYIWSLWFNWSIPLTYLLLVLCAGRQCSAYKQRGIWFVNNWTTGHSGVHWNDMRFGRCDGSI